MLALLMMTPPPLPAPPADRVAAAKELLLTAPIPQELNVMLRDQATFSVTLGMLDRKPNGNAFQDTVRERLTHRVVNSARFATDFDGCMIFDIARTYDVPTIKDIGASLESDDISLTRIPR